MGTVGLGVLAEDPAHTRARDDVAPQRGELLAARDVVAQHAETDVGATVDRPGTPTRTREEIALEEHPEAPVVDAAEVLAERVPRAEICGARGAGLRAGVSSRSSGRRPRRPSSRDAGAVVEGRDERVGCRFERSDARAVAHVDASPAREEHERGVELASRDHARVLTVVGQREHDLAAVGPDDHGLVHRDVRREPADVEAQAVEEAQGARGEAVAARLVAGKRALSITSVEQPSRVASIPAATPAGPAPTTSTSTSSAAMSRRPIA